MNTDPSTPPPAISTEPRFGALVLAALFPGLGHIARGEVGRGVLVMVGVLGLFLGGLFIGGIGVIDSVDNRVWFIGEALNGPLAFGVDWLHQNRYKAYEESALGISSPAELERMKKRPAYPDEVRVVQPVTVRGQTIQVPIFRHAQAGQGPPNRTSIGKVNELGTLFVTIAGMMNLIAIIDAGFPGLPRRTRPVRVRQVGLKTTLADAEAPLTAPATVQDPRQGGMPGGAA